MLKEPEQALLDIWRSMNFPVLENDVINKWYAAIYYNTEGKQYPHLYIGKATNRFLADETGPISQLQLDFLKPHIGQGTLLERQTSKDIWVSDIYNIISGPLNFNVTKADKLNFSVSAY